MSPESPADPRPAASCTPNNTDKLSPEDFALLGVLGVGSFGLVRLAKHAATGAPVALKVLAKETIAATRREAHVVRERRVHAELRHPFVAALYGAFQDRDRVFLALEFLPGGELWSVLYGRAGGDEDDDNNKADGERARAGGDGAGKEAELRPISPVKPSSSADAGLPKAPVLDAAGARSALLDTPSGALREQPAAFYLACIASALRYLHASGVLYRDLKLENVVLDSGGYAKLVDFGFASPYTTASTAGAEDGDPGRRSTLCGSADYMAPEVLLRSTRHDPRVDLWSFGVVMYELLVGRTPFYHDNPRELARRIIHEPVTFPSGFEAAHPLAAKLIRSLLAKNPDERVQSVEELQAHAWFRSHLAPYLDADVESKWARLERRELVPPFVPRLDGAFDASFFRAFDADELRELEDDALPFLAGEDGAFDGF